MADMIVNDPINDAEFSDFFALLKPRVMSLVVFTAAVGLFVAPVSVNLILAFASVCFIALGAGASGALNMWWDADIDKIMRRTQSRPIPSGRINKKNALILGLWLSVIAVGMLGLVSNWAAAGLLAFTIFFYVVIYSMWLKRATPQNIVIGGASGAFPPMVGWVAATGSISLESILMFALIFIWTPPHFWSLALFMNHDYAKAGVPMMTVTHGKPHTRKLIWIYTILLTMITLTLSISSIGGPIYFIVSLLVSSVFLLLTWRLLSRNEELAEADNYADERGVFKFSLIYLFSLFSALLIEAILRNLEITWALWPVWI